MSKPTFEIKKHKHCEGREGVAYSCELWINGELAAYVRQAGNGGMTDFDFTHQRFADILDEHLSTIPPEMPQPDWPDWKRDAWPNGIPADRDGFLAELCDQDESDKIIRRACRTKTVFALHSDPEHIHSLKAPYSKQAADHLRTKHGTDLKVIYNEDAKYSSPSRN